MANLQGKRPSRLMTVPTGPLLVLRSPACGWLIKLASSHSAKSFRDSFWLLAFGGALALPTSTPIPSDQGSVRNPVTLAHLCLAFARRQEAYAGSTEYIHHSMMRTHLVLQSSTSSIIQRAPFSNCLLAQHVHQERNAQQRRPGRKSTLGRAFPWFNRHSKEQNVQQVF